MSKQVSKATMVKVLQWMNSGDTGASSKCMATYLSIGECKSISYPHDPSDLNRCFQLLIRVPELKDNLGKMADLCKEWKELVEVWDNLEKCFVAEVGVNWCNGNSAPITYKAMKEMGC